MPQHGSLCASVHRVYPKPGQFTSPLARDFFLESSFPRLSPRRCAPSLSSKITMP